MFDSNDILNKVTELDEFEGKFTVIQCCSNGIYRQDLQRICELVSLATYQQKMLNIINTME